jgi:hypothetical protein
MRPRAMSLLCVLLTLAVGLAFAQTKKPLTNDDVLQMVKAGFQESMMVKAIEANETNFDVSVQALMDLKSAGVTQPIIEAMLAAEAKKKAPVPAVKPANAPPPDPNDPRSPHASGIYWKPTQGADKRMVRLEPSTYSRGKTSGMFGAAMSMGISKVKWKIVINGDRAALRIAEAAPEFWFYFGTGQETFSSGPASPDDFLLVRVEKKGKDRELIVGQTGLAGTSAGTRSRDTLALESKQVAPGIYQVRPSSALEPGEYAFMRAGVTMENLASGKLFDFGVELVR